MTRPAATAPTASNLRALRAGVVRPRGWILAQARQDLEHGYAGCLDTLSPHVARDLYASRLAQEDDSWAWWDGESRGNWLWGYLMLAHAADLPDHIERAHALVRDLRATQDPASGYLGIYAPALRHRDGSVEHGELWTQSRALLALLTHHELTGDSESLRAVQRCADATLAAYMPSHPAFGRAALAEDRTGITHGLCWIDVLQALHAATGESRYLHAARDLLADFDAWPVPFPNDDLAAANVGDPAVDLRGHAVHTAEHLRLQAHGGAVRVRAALTKLRGSATPSGALIGDESLHGLPHPGAGYEYCTLVELACSLMHLGIGYADASLGDWLERLVFNAAQGARAADGRALAYLSVDTRLEASARRPDTYSLVSGKHGRYKLSPTHDDVACCCNPNSLRLWPHYLAAMWVDRMDEAGLVAIAHGPADVATTIDGAPVAVRVDTDYPFEDLLRYVVEVERPCRFSLSLRRPSWARGVRVVGADAHVGQDWIVVERTWSGRDEFSVHFDTHVRTERYPTGEVAVLRGALQFVRPIAHRVTQLPVAGRPDWPDLELWPAVEPAEPEPVAIDPATVAQDWLVVRTDLTPQASPWSEPPLRLRQGEVTLVPLGAAPLRRADFRVR